MPDLDALLAGEPSASVAGAFASRDVADATGWAETTVNHKMRRAIKAGLIEFAGRERRASTDHIYRSIPVYRVVKDAKKKT